MPKRGHLTLAGAGGKHICAACVPVAVYSDLVVDQTLYWRVVSDEDEALFCVGMLNSHAMTEAIMPFNPEGAFGPRHIHTLPYRLMPAFDPLNEDHAHIAALAGQITADAREAVAADAYLRNPDRKLADRRARLRDVIQESEPGQHLERLCGAILGTKAFVDGIGG